MPLTCKALCYRYKDCRYAAQCAPLKELKAELNKYLYFMHVAFVVQGSMYSLSPTTLLIFSLCLKWGSPCSLVGKEPACNVGDPDLIPGSGRSHGEGNGNPPQDSCLENPMDRGSWQVTVHGVAGARHNLATKPPPYLKWVFPVLHLTTVFQHLLYLLLENFHNFCLSVNCPFSNGKPCLITALNTSP